MSWKTFLWTTRKVRHLLWWFINNRVKFLVKIVDKYILCFYFFKAKSRVMQSFVHKLLFGWNLTNLNYIFFPANRLKEWFCIVSQKLYFFNVFLRNINFIFMPLFSSQSQRYKMRNSSMFLLFILLKHDMDFTWKKTFYGKLDLKNIKGAKDEALRGREARK